MAYEPTSKKAPNAVQRLSKRAAYDEETIFGILDHGSIAHVTFQLPPDELGGPSDEDWPHVIPMIYARNEDTVYIHGHLSSRTLKALSNGDVKCAITVTTVQGIVVAVTAFHNSNNYQSVCLYGYPRLVTDAKEKDMALAKITNHTFRVPGEGEIIEGDRWADSRAPESTEIASTRVIAVKIVAASAKVRRGGPNDEEKDKKYADKYWTGHIVKKEIYTEAVPSPYNKNVPLPQYIKDMIEIRR